MTSFEITPPPDEIEDNPFRAQVSLENGEGDFEAGRICIRPPIGLTPYTADYMKHSYGIQLEHLHSTQYGTLIWFNFSDAEIVDDNQGSDQERLKEKLGACVTELIRDAGQTANPVLFDKD